MGDIQSLSPSRLLFDLAARLGSLEGYLHAEEKVEKKYLPNWLENIDREFNALAPEVGKEVQPDYLELLEKVCALLRKVYGEQDANAIKVATMISTVGKLESR